MLRFFQGEGWDTNEQLKCPAFCPEQEPCKRNTASLPYQQCWLLCCSTNALSLLFAPPSLRPGMTAVLQSEPGSCAQMGSGAGTVCDPFPGCISSALHSSLMNSGQSCCKNCLKICTKGKKSWHCFSALHHCHHRNTAFKLGLSTGNKLKYFNCSKGRIKRPFLFQPHHCILCAAAACFVPHPLPLGAAAQLLSE